jgi:hypothetical protein
MTGIPHPFESPIGQVNELNIFWGIQGKGKHISEKTFLGNTGSNQTEIADKKQGFFPKDYRCSALGALMFNLETNVFLRIGYRKQNQPGFQFHIWHRIWNFPFSELPCRTWGKKGFLE